VRYSRRVGLLAILLAVFIKPVGAFSAGTKLTSHPIRVHLTPFIPLISRLAVPPKSGCENRVLDEGAPQPGDAEPLQLQYKEF
jgi:hypothetical protein